MNRRTHAVYAAVIALLAGLGIAESVRLRRVQTAHAERLGLFAAALGRPDCVLVVDLPPGRAGDRSVCEVRRGQGDWEIHFDQEHVGEEALFSIAGPRGFEVRCGVGVNGAGPAEWEVWDVEMIDALGQ